MLYLKLGVKPTCFCRVKSIRKIANCPGISFALFETNNFGCYGKSISNNQIRYFKGGFAIENCGITYRRELATSWMNEFNKNLPRKLKKKIFRYSKSERLRNIEKIRRKCLRVGKVLQDLCVEHDLIISEVLK